MFLHPLLTGGPSVAGSNSTLTIKGIKGNGRPQWVSFYYHNPDGLCECSPKLPEWLVLMHFASVGDNRGVSGQSFKLARFATVSVNGAAPVTLRQRDTNAGVIMTQTLNVTFTKGSDNSITIGGLNGGKLRNSRLHSFMLKTCHLLGVASDIDRIIVYDSD